MGVCGIICKAIMGPILIYCLIMSHVVYQVVLEKPEALEVEDFGKQVTAQQRDAIIAARKPLIKAMMQAFSGKYQGDFLKDWCTDDFEFEDPLQKYEGVEEMGLVLQACQRYLTNGEFVVHSEHHAPHEIVMDWTMTLTTTWAPTFPLSLRMRTHIMLEPSSNNKEKIFRVFEEWNGNKQLNEKTTLPLLGKIHRALRRFVGIMGSSFMSLVL